MATSIDLGSDKVLCLIGSIGEENIVIKGIGHQKSFGISHGTITDIKLAQKSVISAVSTAEKMAGFNIKKVVVGLSGKYLVSSFISAETNVNDKIKRENLSSIAENIIMEYRKNNQEILHLVPIEYILDKNIRVENPIGIAGNKLLINFHIVSYPTNQIKNIEACLKKYQLTIKNYISSPYASALACMTENERKLGTLLIDIGAQETSFCVFYNGKFMYNNSVPLGGYNITKDISTILEIGKTTAERIKTLNVDFTLNDIEEEDTIKIDFEDDENSFNIVKHRIKLINDISKCRIEEIIRIVFEAIKKKRLRDKVNRIVLSGGTSIIPGIDAFIEELTDVPARLGSIKNDVVVEDMSNNIFRSTIYACAIGMLIFVKRIFKKARANGLYCERGYLVRVVFRTVRWFVT